MSLTTRDFCGIGQRDELLAPFVTDDLISEALDRLHALAKELGIKDEDVIPTPYVKQYVRAFVFMEIAKGKSYSASAGVWDASENHIASDVFYNKYTMYKTEFEQLEKSLNEKTITGKIDSQGWRAINLYRG